MQSSLLASHHVFPEKCQNAQETEMNKPQKQQTIRGSQSNCMKFSCKCFINALLLETPRCSRNLARNKFLIIYIFKYRSLNQVLLGWQPIYMLCHAASPAQLARPHFLVVWSLSLTSLIKQFVCVSVCVVVFWQACNYVLACT